MLRNSFLAAAAALSMLASLTALALSDEQLEAIENRIKPVGEVCLDTDAVCPGTTDAAALAAVATGSTAEAATGRSGEDVYNAACMACHMTGAAGAPVLGDVAAWAPRIDKGMDALYDSGLNGVAGGAMMAKGGCMSCSDEEINAAVDYMVNNSQ